MIVCVSITEQLCRSVFVKMPDESPTYDAVKFVKDRYYNGDIVLDADDFVSHSGEVCESYTETDDGFIGRVDYVI